MRLRIKAKANENYTLPFNYQNQVKYAVKNLIAMINWKVEEVFPNKQDRENWQKVVRKLNEMKLYSFSKLNVSPFIMSQNGFQDVERITFIFTTPLKDEYKDMVAEIFKDRVLRLDFDQNLFFTIEDVEFLEEPNFGETASFVCLSPITLSKKWKKDNGKEFIHYLEYTNDDERYKFVQAMRENLVEKWETLNQTEYKNDTAFSFEFSKDYIERKDRISKLIHLENGSKVKAFEAPFEIQADPELIHTGYRCGFGEKNNLGFGCVKTGNGES